MDGAGEHNKMTEKTNRWLGRLTAIENQRNRLLKTRTGLGKTPMPDFYDELQIL